MDVLSATKARANLFRLIDETAEAHKPVLITGQRNNAVLVSQEDWNAMQETLYLASIPGMAESIIEGGQTSVDECINLEELKLGLASSADETSS
jgi:antitoxin YefM